MIGYYKIEGLNPHGVPCYEYIFSTLEEVKEWHKKHIPAPYHSVCIHSLDGELQEVIYLEYWGEIKRNKMIKCG